MTDQLKTEPVEEKQPVPQQPEPVFIGWSAILKGSALLVGTLLVGVVIAGFVMQQKYGTPGVIATLCAGAICSISGVAALVVTGFGTGQKDGLTYTLGSIAIRTGIPLGSAIVVSNTIPYLAKAGFFGVIIVLYLLTLSAETLLSVRLLKKQMVTK